MIGQMIKTLISGVMIILGISFIALYIGNGDMSFWWLAAGNILTLLGLDIRFSK